jgi:hypothetical protein
MNKAKLRQAYTVSGTFTGDIAISIAIGVMWYGILVVFYSF